MDARTQDNSIAGSQDRTLVITRVFDAPRELVFGAWTDMKHLLAWMGSRDYPAMHVESDFRPGGRWRIALRALDGSRNLWQSGIYREIEEPEKLVFTFAWDDENGRPGPETLVTILLADQQGKTKMTFRQAVFDTVPNRDGHRGGWNSAFDRLKDFLASARVRR